MAFAVWIENRTPFPAASHVQLNADGQEVLVVMLSASFHAAEQDENLRPAEQQVPVVFGDVPFGDPARSSIRYESDIAPLKPMADVIVNGTAHAPNGKPVREMQVGVRVGGLRKMLHVMGDRIYDAGGYSAPHPFRSMPIVYERAFGGMTEDGRAEARNPVGVGHHHAASADPAVKTQAPNVTYPDQPFLKPGDTPAPAGFGAIGRNWRPRIGFAGTYDQAWLDTQWPLPPKDIDPRFHLSAPSDQQLPRLGGGEEVTMVGLTPSGRWSFRIPRVTAPVRLIYDDRMEEAAFTPDTVLIEPDQWRVTLKARMTFITRRNAPALREIVFGHVSPVLLSARRKGKEYFTPLGGDGTLRDRPVWQA